MTASLDWKVEGNDCGFWLRQADPCTHAVHIATVITEALSAIAFLGGVLLLLTQQGYNLGGLNAISQSLNPTLLYTLISLSGTLFLLDTAFIFALLRHYTNQVHRPEVLANLDLLNNINDTHIDPNPLHYSCYIAPESPSTDTEQGQPAVFAVLSKNSAGETSVVPFKTEELLQAHISRLENLNYKPMDEEAFQNRTKISIKNVKHLLDDHKWLTRKCASLANGLPSGYFTFERIALVKNHSAHHCTLFAVKQKNSNDVEHFISFTISLKEAGEVGAEIVPDCLNYETIVSAVDTARIKNMSNPINGFNVSKTLNRNSFVEYTGSFTHLIYEKETYREENRMLFIITYRKKHGLNEKTEFFFTDDDKKTRLKELGFIK